MFGQLQLEKFTACGLPQKAASAWSGAFGALVGAEYKPLLYLGEQNVHGTSYYFVAEQTLMTNPLVRRVIKLVIHELNGEYKLLTDSILEIA